MDDDDLRREDRALALLKERFSEWQEKGFIPSRAIEHGYNTDQPIRERGWTHWHHLFNPRQLLTLGTINSTIDSDFKKETVVVAHLLGVAFAVQYNCRLSRYRPQEGNEGRTESVFSNQALNTLLNYGCRSTAKLEDVYKVSFPLFQVSSNTTVEAVDARASQKRNELWMTDPPYADAINYHELTDFFLSWSEHNILKAFPDWYTDTKKALAIRGSGEDFKRSMVDSYANLTKHMPENGLQLVMFTHQDASVWADLAMILWAAGLKVTAAWTIATETTSGIKKGNYVQGTVLLVLRKRTTNETAFLDELYPEIADEVRHQLDQECPDLLRATISLI